MDGADIKTVAAHAQDRFRANGFLRSHLLTVEARDDNTVVISGQVPSYHHKQMAQENIYAIVAGYLIKNDVEVVR